MIEGTREDQIRMKKKQFNKMYVVQHTHLHRMKEKECL